MKNKAFTLIEVLIVVLIIGILAAIALPQYKKMVIKTQFSELVNALKALVNAQSIYYIANGTYTANRDSLDLTFPLTDTRRAKQFVQVSKYIECGLDGAPRNVYCKNNKIGIELLYFYHGQYWCTNSNVDNYYNDELCKKLLNVSKTTPTSATGRKYEGTRLHYPF